MRIEASAIKAVWTRSQNVLGHDSGRLIGSNLAQEGLLTYEEVPYAARFIDHQPTEPFVYDGAIATVRTLITRGNNVLIWTQGEPRQQMLKIASSGVLQLRRDPQIPHAKERLNAYAHVDKINDLPNVIADVHLAGDVVIVDDKSKNVVRAKEHIDRLKKSGEISPGRNIDVIWINQGRTMNEVPDGFSVSSFKAEYSTIEDIRELTKRYEDTDGTTFLLDWDHTLCNTTKWKEHNYQGIADRLSRHPIVNHFVDERVGIADSEIEQVYTNGNSGSGVKRVKLPNGEQMVVKFRLNDRERLVRERFGHALVRESPLEPHVLPLDTTHIHRGILTTPHYPGVCLREGIRQGTINDDVVRHTFEQLLALKTEWWSGQKHQAPAEVRSMLRSEWNDTLQQLENLVLPHMAEAAETSVDALKSLPLHQGDVCLPPIGEVLAFMSDFLSDSAHVPYTVNAHNDATGANIVVNPETHEWKLFDYEWAGSNDPAEALTRVIKQVSSSTVRSISASARCNATGLEIDVTCDVSPLAIELQKIGMNAAKMLENKMGDPELFERLQHYLVGSYLREAALSPKRGGNPTALFALTNAARLVYKYDIYP